MSVSDAAAATSLPEATLRHGGERVRVLHFVTGGFSGGATQVAIGLVRAAQDSDVVEPLLVLRRKRRTDPARIEELRQAGLPVAVVPGWSHAATIAGLVALCRRFQPQVLVAHGFSEHLWGRYAGLIANVPALVHVEHNTRERYTAWRLAQTRWLARRTARIVGCSEGVRLRLLEMGMPPERTVAIPNGVPLERFDSAAADFVEEPPAPADDTGTRRDRPSGGATGDMGDIGDIGERWMRRVPGIVMTARYSKQKDHATLIRALALLRDRGLQPPLLLAGGGKPAHRRPVEHLVQTLGLQSQVQFLGLCRDVPGLLMSHRICVLSTHYEGMPLALLEGMAAGCAVVGSAVPGVREVLRDGQDGRLVPEADPVALADALQALLTSPATAYRLAAAARQSALARYGRELMHQRYEALFLGLASSGR